MMRRSCAFFRSVAQCKRELLLCLPVHRGGDTGLKGIVPISKLSDAGGRSILLKSDKVYTRCTESVLRRCYTQSAQIEDKKPSYSDFCSRNKATILLNQAMDAASKKSRHDPSASSERIEKMLRNALKRSRKQPNHPRIPHPDAITFAIAIDAWANDALMNTGAASRAEDLLRFMESVHKDYCARNNKNAATLKVNTRAYIGVLKAYAHSSGTNPSAARRAESLFFEMQDLYESRRNIHARPNLIAFNFVLHAWSRSAERGRAEHAQTLLHQMESMFQSGISDFQPTTMSYNVVLNAWAKSRDFRAPYLAEAILDRMIVSHNENTSPLSPDAISFTCVINAWARSGKRFAAEKAENILRRMVLKKEDGGYFAFADLKPDVVCFTAVIDAHAKSGLQGSGQRAERLLNELHRLYDETRNFRVRPNGYAYNSVIHAYANSRDPNSIQHVERLLRKMEENCSNGNKLLYPTRVTLNSVLSAYANSRDADAFAKAEALLKRMENSCGNDTSPDIVTYSIVLSSLVKRDTLGKVQEAYQFFGRMKKRAETGNPNIIPTATTYGIMLSVCSNVNANEDERANARKVLFEIMDEIEHSKVCTVTSPCYAIFFKACGALIDDQDELNDVFKKYFRSCCEAGLVNVHVMHAIRVAVPTFHKRILMNISGQLPEEWTINAEASDISRCMHKRISILAQHDMMSDRLKARASIPA